MNVIIFFFIIIFIPAEIMLKQIDDLFIKKETQRTIANVKKIGLCFFLLSINLLLWEIMLSHGAYKSIELTFGATAFTAEQLIIRGAANLAFALWVPQVAHQLWRHFSSKSKSKIIFIENSVKNDTKTRMNNFKRKNIINKILEYIFVY